MSMPDLDLFAWWALSISFSIIFLTFISIYLFVDSKSRRKDGLRGKGSVFRMGKEFAFVFVLLGLLVFYIFSIQLARASALGVLAEAVFTVGNIIVEVLLVLYLLRNREKESE
jgi:4-hydroxybenzoate polyprenyltransferase